MTTDLCVRGGASDAFSAPVAVPRHALAATARLATASGRGRGSRQTGTAIAPRWAPRGPPEVKSGGRRTRTDDPLLAKQMLSQLSYTPGLKGEVRWERERSHTSDFTLPTSRVGVPELESGTSSLSATRSNQLSYTPVHVPQSGRRRTQPDGRRVGSADAFPGKVRQVEARKCTQSASAVKGSSQNRPFPGPKRLGVIRRATSSRSDGQRPAGLTGNACRACWPATTPCRA